MDAMLRDFTNAYGAGEDGVTAFTEYDIERWKQIVDDQEPLEEHPTRSARRNSAPCGAH
jgi:hypothetical protein